MSVSGILDALLVLLLLAYFSYGWVAGLVRSAFGLAGIVVGGIAAFFAVPLIGSWLASPVWRVLLVIASVVALLVAGQALGAAVGRMLRRRVEEAKLSSVDRLGGAVMNTVVTALIASAVAFSVGSFGVPVLTQAIAGSSVLRTIDAVTPDPVRSGLAQLRSIVIQQGIPRIISAAGGTAESPAPVPPPEVVPGSSSLEEAARSVVKVTGSAYRCGQNQSGSGFVAAANRVVTNAHVVAGVEEPVVEVPGIGAAPGRIVYFDPASDLAVIAVDALDAAPIPLGSALPEGGSAVFDGYPHGGPFQSGPARVDRVTTVRVNDIYGGNPSTLEVYQLAADVQEGNSGGPLLSLDGLVAGLIFAKSADTEGIGYALTLRELQPVIEQAASLFAPVSSGDCIQR